jgi:hypothetical protein
VLLLAIFVVSRGCQRGGQEISADEAVVIATDAVDFEPDDHAVRFQRRGTSFSPHWNVSLWEVSETGERANLTVVVVDAQSGEVVDIVRED